MIAEALGVAPEKNLPSRYSASQARDGATDFHSSVKPSHRLGFLNKCPTRIIQLFIELII
ncbi:hypothetical protein KCP69_00525 [Salmonella enterica subsp. enterica]|nr:hypothetical protein KCP69_00525 [Salmonella enterica subsp. enterica]